MKGRTVIYRVVREGFLEEVIFELSPQEKELARRDGRVLLAKGTACAKALGREGPG